MIELLARLFSRHDTPADHLLQAAADAVVEGTDPRLRAASHPDRHLRQPVRTAIDYVRALVRHLEPPVELSSATFGSDPRVHALFGSVESMRQAIGRDPTLRAFEHERGHAGSAETFALLLAERRLKHVLGMDLQGELVMRDVQRTLLLFSGHRLRAVAANAADASRAARILAFRQLIGAACSRLESVKAGQSFGGDAEGGLTNMVDAELADIADRWRRTGAATLTLDDYLVLVADVLTHPERYLRAEPFTAVVDRMGAVADTSGAAADAESITYWELARPAREAPTAALMVRFRCADFPPPAGSPELL
jgi:hypothetical protein